MVFQSYAIWPHMTVFDNVAYGLRVRQSSGAPRWPSGCAGRSSLVQMGDLAARSASKLSGGQQQRVALARAFVFSPSVLLFDEPLSATSTPSCAPRCGIEIKELQRRLGITSVYVTHDLEEALAISDRIVVMRDGVIEQIGTPAEIYDLPRNTFVADFVGSANLIRGRHRPDLERDGLVVLETAGGALVHGTAFGRRVGGRRSSRCAPCTSGSRASVRPARERVAGRACGAACSRATSPSTTWTGTAGARRAPLRRRRIRWPRATTVFLSVEPRHCVLLED